MSIDPAGWATDPSVTDYKLTPRLRAACANGWAALGEASEPVSPKGEPSNPSISSNGSPSSPEIPDNPLNEGNSASTGSL